MNKYSVLMSVYYKEKAEFLQQSILSMLAQTIPCEQFIIVKDGPLTSELDAIIEKFANVNPEIFTIVRLEENGGLGHALDYGIRYSRNDLIARMDSDDISLPCRCEMELKAFDENNELSIIGTYINEFYDNPENVVSSRVVPTRHDDIVKYARRRSPFNHPTVMYKKSAVIACGGYGGNRRKEDLKLFPKMINSGYISCNIPKALLLFRSNADNYKRRKSWINCREYIGVIYDNWKNGYSGFTDFIYVFFAQLFLFLVPMRIMKLVSDKILRKAAFYEKAEENRE